MIIIGILSGLCASAFLYLLYDIFRCKHQWEFVDKTDFPAPIETLQKNGVQTVWGHHIPELSKKTVVIVIRCPKCGASKILRETH